MTLERSEGIILFLTGDTDPHCVDVARELKQRHQNVVTIDPGLVPRHGVVESSYRGRTGSAELKLGSARIRSGSVKSVWYRRPSPIQIDPGIESEYAKPAAYEWTAFLLGLWDSLDKALWVSQPSAIRRAEFKLGQLRIAQRVGFKIPDTLVTNDETRIAGFFEQTGRKMVIKKIYTPMIDHGPKTTLLVTRLIRDIQEIPLDELRLCPCIFQEYVEKRVDLRVVVIGKAIFSVGIDSQSLESTRVDWRTGSLADTVRLAHEPTALPAAVARACFRMLREYGLQFGVFDLVLRPDGELVFLELNPNGQWLWLQPLTGLDLVGAMADLLAHVSQRYTINGEIVAEPAGLL